MCLNLKKGFGLVGLAQERQSHMPNQQKTQLCVSFLWFKGKPKPKLTDPFWSPCKSILLQSPARAWSTSPPPRFSFQWEVSTNSGPDRPGAPPACGPWRFNFDPFSNGISILYSMLVGGRISPTARKPLGKDPIAFSDAISPFLVFRLRGKRRNHGSAPTDSQ